MSLDKTLIKPEKMKVKWSSASCLTLKREKEFLKRLEVSQIKKQIEVLLTFMPDEILYYPIAELNKIHKFVGVLLFADVSGFTPLTEKYNKTGKGGIYRLTATLNAYIGAIVEVIYYFGGDVLKFSGDAFLALWKAQSDAYLYEVLHEVIVCALFIQNTLGFFETEVNVLLKVKLAISCGNLTISVIGNEKFKHYVILGQAVNDVKAAEHVSVSGDVVISPAAWGHLAEGSYDVTYANGGNVKVWKCIYKSSQKDKQQLYTEKFMDIQMLCEKHIELRNTLHECKKFNENITDSYLIDKFVESLPPRKTSNIAVQQWIMSELSPFIIRPVLEQVEEKQPLQYLTEMREITIQFINIIPSAFDEDKLITMIDSAYQIVCKIVSNVSGVVNKVSLFDKDVMMLVLFGMKGVKHELESQNALKSAYKIKKEIVKLDYVKNVSVGITYGLVYCGVVGHPLRKEYTVIGGPVNKAARIMCAYQRKVTCDYETYSNSKLSSTYFQLQSSFKLKGIESAGHIFEYNEDFEEGLQHGLQNVPLYGRQEEVIFVQEVLAGVLFKGDSKSGKTYLLEYFYDKCLQRKDYLTAFVALCGGSQRPYHCLSLIYRQLFDQVAQIESSGISLDSFKRNLWDLNEIIQEKLLPSPNEIADRKGSIADMFTKICSIKTTILLIDNAQYIDKRSFEILKEAMKKGKLKLICSGTFEETSWDTLWRFSLTDTVRIVDLEPLEAEYIPHIICQFLNVEGVPKKLCNLIDRTCEGKPGWIESCMLKLVNTGGIENDYVLYDESMNEWMVFPHLQKRGSRFTENESRDDGKRHIVPIVTLTTNADEKTEDLSLAAISLDLFDSFTTYEQLIIKTAAVLGESFTRTLLVIMLNYPNMQIFTNAMLHLFQEKVFECGSKYINSGGRYSRQTTCSCYLRSYQLETENTNLPKYAYCKNLHFKNKTLRSVAYELIPANQKKELHLKTTEILESQNNSCPNCLRDNSSSIFQFYKFSVVTDRAEGKNEVESIEFSGVDIPTNIVKEIIRESMKTESSTNRQSAEVIPSRKIWDPTVCFCLEILTRVYGDLVYHSGKAGHASKTIFFLYQNGLILSLLDELEGAVQILKEASELCIRHIYDKTRVKTSFARYLFAKVCALLAEIYFGMNNWRAAKNYCMLTLRQFDIPMVSLYFANHLKFFKLDRMFNSRKRTDDHSKDSIGKCLSVISRIFAAEGKWNLAVAIASRSLELVKYSNPNLELLCDVYSTALDMHSFKGHIHICEQLARNLGQELIKLYGNNLTSEIFSVAKLMYIIFQIKAKSGVILIATRMGFRIFELNRLLHAYVFQVEVIPVLDFLLILQKRLEEVIFITRYLKNMSKKYDNRGVLAYYAVCLIMMVEANFYLEPMDAIEAYVDKHFLGVKGKSAFTPIENTLIVFMYSYFIREGRSTKAASWRRMYGYDSSMVKTFFDVFNRLKFIETNLIILCKNIESKNTEMDFTQQRLSQILDGCSKNIEMWKIFAPRHLHCKAYLKKLSGRRRQASDLLRQAQNEAESMGNILEQSWITLSENCWKGNFHVSENKGPVFWKFANSYSSCQWSQMMFVLPIP
ncbi:hypothetical protein HHI36_021098 [Cryptolaemus montrouzieri]|uniref:Guanylate cyclase domain-containing protein n=1 Tax=Cryptolaemus montrouzieri TaxID=559131 RepID=A0ABD2MVX8_9CUCU